MTDPDVSVVIPTRNAGGVIGDCLRSLHAQKGLDLEIIVVDALSEDDTVASSRPLADRVIERKCTTTRGRLIGAELSRAPFVLSLDADQRVAPGALRSALELGKPLVAFEEVPLGSGLVAKAIRLDNAVRARRWQHELDPLTGSIIPRLYRGDRLLLALRRLPGSLIDLEPAPLFAEDTLIFSAAGAQPWEVGFVARGLAHVETESVRRYWRKWRRYGLSAKNYRGTGLEEPILHRATSRSWSSLSLASFPALLLRAPPFVLGYLS